MKARTGPLSGIRVLDGATHLAGPTAASLLSEFGAEIIKVEEPVGDHMRHVGPHRGKISVWWKSIARNRQSMTLDLRNEEGRKVFKELAGKCDVVVLNYRPETIKKWGLGFEELKKFRKDIVYFHLTAYGSTGPYAQKPGFARVAEAFAGLTNRTGFPGQPPVQSGYPMLGDSVAGLYGAFSILLALRERDLTGEAQSVDLGLYEPMLRLNEDLIIGYTETGKLLDRMGNSSPHWAPHGVFPTKDGRYITVLATTEKIWQNIRAEIGDPSLTIYDNDSPARVRDRPKLDEIVGNWTRQYDMLDLVKVCEKANIAIGPIYSPEEIVKDPHIIARESIVTVDDPESGKPIRMSSSAGRFSGFKGAIRSLGPKLGAHTETILKDLLNYSPAQIEALRKQGVVK